MNWFLGLLVDAAADVLIRFLSMALRPVPALSRPMQLHPLQPPHPHRPTTPYPTSDASVFASWLVNTLPRGNPLAAMAFEGGLNAVHGDRGFQPTFPERSADVVVEDAVSEASISASPDVDPAELQGMQVRHSPDSSDTGIAAPAPDAAPPVRERGNSAGDLGKSVGLGKRWTCQWGTWICLWRRCKGQGRHASPDTFKEVGPVVPVGPPPGHRAAVGLGIPEASPVLPLDLPAAPLDPLKPLDPSDIGTGGLPGDAGGSGCCTKSGSDVNVDAARRLRGRPPSLCRFPSASAMQQLIPHLHRSSERCSAHVDQT